MSPPLPSGASQLGNSVTCLVIGRSTVYAGNPKGALAQAAPWPRWLRGGLDFKGISQSSPLVTGSFSISPPPIPAVFLEHMSSVGHHALGVWSALWSRKLQCPISRDWWGARALGPLLTSRRLSCFWWCPTGVARQCEYSGNDQWIFFLFCIWPSLCVCWSGAPGYVLDRGHLLLFWLKWT